MKFNTLFNIVGSLFVLLLLAVVLSNCNPVNKVLTNPKKFEQVAKEVVKKGYCINDTIIKTKSDTLVTYDTSVVEQRVTDTIIKDGDTIYLPGVTRQKLITKNVVIHDTISNTVRDKKLEEIYKTERDHIQGSFNLKVEELKVMTGKRNYWRLRFFGLLVLIAIDIYVRFRKKV